MKRIILLVLVSILFFGCIGMEDFFYQQFPVENQDELIKTAKTYLEENSHYHSMSLSDPKISRQSAEFFLVKGKDFQFRVFLVQASGFPPVDLTCIGLDAKEELVGRVNIPQWCSMKKEDQEGARNFVLSNKTWYLGRFLRKDANVVDLEVKELEKKLLEAEWTKDRMEIFRVNFDRATEGLGCQPYKVSVYLDKKGNVLATSYVDMLCID